MHLLHELELTGMLSYSTKPNPLSSFTSVGLAPNELKMSSCVSLNADVLFSYRCPADSPCGSTHQICPCSILADAADVETAIGGSEGHCKCVVVLNGMLYTVSD